jgi:undecaprenyl-diphosphatase
VTVPVRRRPADAWTAALAVGVTALCAWAVAPGAVGPVERAVFRFVNGWPDSLFWPLWGFQLVGVLGIPLLLAVAAAVRRRWRLAGVLVLLVPLKLLVERAVLKELAPRERPGSTILGAELRDVPSAGFSFPSGHAIIAAGVVVLLLPYLHVRWKVALLVALAVLNAVSRVYLGAHSPLDILGGAAAGVAVAALLNLLAGVPVGPSARAGVEPGEHDVGEERRWRFG